MDNCKPTSSLLIVTWTSIIHSTNNLLVGCMECSQLLDSATMHTLSCVSYKKELKSFPFTKTFEIIHPSIHYYISENFLLRSSKNCTCLCMGVVVPKEARSVQSLGTGVTGDRELPWVLAIGLTLCKSSQCLPAGPPL